MNQYMNTGIIYKITNTANVKIYIGLTKEYHGDGSTKVKYGIQGRLSNHFSCAFSKNKKNDCPMLYNAIRKYGKESFMIEEICKCSTDKVEEKEIYYIKEYDSINKKIGYNISLGGDGNHRNKIKEETRMNISKSQRQGIMNITPYYKEKILVGYIARRKENGKQFQKYFTSTKFSPEENKLKAIQYINSIKNNKDDSDINKKYNKENNLPKNINLAVNKNKKICGYTVHIMKEGKKYSKTFQKSYLSMEEKLQLAINYKNSVLNSQN